MLPVRIRGAVVDASVRVSRARRPDHHDPDAELDRSGSSRHPGADATCDTALWNIWSAAVYEIAGVPVEEARAAASPERIQSWYQVGEPAWMAAHTLRAFVDGARRALREDDGRAAIRAAHRASRRR